MKKIFLFLIALWLFLPQLTQAASVEVQFFYSKTCPHCQKEEIFLDKLEKDYGDKLKINRYEVSDPDSVKLLMQYGRELNMNIRSVPITIVGDKYFIGYSDDQTSGLPIKEQIDLALGNQPAEDQGASQMISVPVLGTIDAASFSLPALSVILGLLDGFNPCAMWVLIFLIGLLLGMQNRRRMWVLGTTFIVASALVYFVFMAAWLHLILFLGFIVWIRIIIGLVAMAAGGYNIKEFFTNKNATCKVTGQEKRRRIFDRLKAITQEQKFWLALGGIILLAFAVNLVELLCSAGFPAVFTQVLAINDLSNLARYGYILLYIFFFMLDDLLIFIIAMITLKITGLSTKYSRISNIVGGILMVLIGLLLIFKPEVLSFA